MLKRAAAFVVVIAFACSSRESGSPTAPSTLGQLRFIDSGCACADPPFPGTPIFVDGQQAGILPAFGELKVTVAAGDHVWSMETLAAPTPVHVDPGGTTKVRIMTNIDCTDGCPDPLPPGN